MRRSRRNKAPDVYREISKNLESCWIAAIILSPFILYNLFTLLEGNFSLLNMVILIFISLIFIQSVRGIIVLGSLKKQMLIKPGSISLSQVYSAPSIKRFIWFIN